ncbi:MAG: hypothetical protein IJ833_11120 [Lachnospiraceae bacterium]|nr:hypothetical protein [Lachnospiraceae bacterium]
MIGLHNKYKEDYEHVPEVDGKGRFRDRFYYTGDIYLLPFDEVYKKKTYLPCIGFGLLMLGALLGQGLLNQPSSKTVWVVLPYLAQFLPALFYFLGVMEYGMAGIRMKKPDYEKGVQRMRYCAIGLIALSLISALADGVYLIRSLIQDGRTVGMGREILYFACHGLTIGAALGFGVYYDRIFSGITHEKSK